MHFYDRVLWSVAPDLCIFTTVSYGLWLWIYAFLRPCPMVCGSGSMHFCDRVLRSAVLDLCILQPCPMVCGSGSMHFCDSVLRSVVLDLCIFTTVSYGLWLWIYAFL